MSGSGIAGHLVFNHWKTGPICNWSASLDSCKQKKNVFFYYSTDLKWFRLINHSKYRQECTVFEWSGFRMTGSSLNGPFRNQTSWVFEWLLCFDLQAQAVYEILRFEEWWGIEHSVFASVMSLVLVINHNLLFDLVLICLLCFNIGRIWIPDKKALYSNALIEFKRQCVF
jgi:hypothetical protein